MHWLTQFQQYVVGHVNHRINGADAATTQLLAHPQRACRFDIDAFYYAAQVTRARLRRVNANWQRIRNSGGYRAHIRLGQGNLVQHPNVTRYTDNAQAVGTVWRYADFDGVVVKRQVFTDIGANRRVFRQLNDTVVIVGNAQLGERTQHAFGRLAAQFGGFDLEVTRQYCAYGGNRHLQAGTAIWCATDDVQQAIATHVDLGHAQFVCVRVLTALNHMAYYHAVKGAGNRLHAVYFQTGHGNLIG
ncbi:hypothetical protein D3C79_649390 [compost metagenome]